MNMQREDSNQTKYGFWQRLAIMIEAMDESDDDRLERRVRQLEAEVSRLSRLQAGTDAGTVAPQAAFPLPTQASGRHPGGTSGVPS